MFVQTMGNLKIKENNLFQEAIYNIICYIKSIMHLYHILYHIMLYYISTTVYKYFVYKHTYVYNIWMCVSIYDYFSFSEVVKYYICMFNTLVLALPKYGTF